MPKVISLEQDVAGGATIRTKLIVPVLDADPSGGALVEGLVWFNRTDNVFRYYDGTIVITPGSGSLTAEDVRDTVGAALVAGANIDITVNDAGDTITIDVEALTSADIGDFAEAVSDQLGTMVTGNTETGITVTYQDSDNTIDFVVTDSPLLEGQTSAQIQAAIVAAIVDSSPGTLDTLNELAAALGDDANFATTTATALATKARTYVANLTGGALTENVDHNLGTRDVAAQVYVLNGTDANSPDEDYIIERPTVNRVVVKSEGQNIPANRRIVVFAVGA